jgi:hypothetical protein
MPFWWSKKPKLPVAAPINPILERTAFEPEPELVEEESSFLDGPLSEDELKDQQIRIITERISYISEKYRWYCSPNYRAPWCSKFGNIQPNELIHVIFKNVGRNFDKNRNLRQNIKDLTIDERNMLQNYLDEIFGLLTGYGGTRKKNKRRPRKTRKNKKGKSKKRRM